MGTAFLWAAWAIGIGLIFAAIANKDDMQLFLVLMAASFVVNAWLVIALVILWRRPYAV